MASEEITRKCHADFRNWYEMPSGDVIGVLDDDIQPFRWGVSGTVWWRQAIAGQYPVISPAVPNGER